MQWMNWVKWACDSKQFRHFYNELKYISTLNDYTKIDSNVNGRWGNRKLWGVYLTISVISIVHLTTLQHSHYCCCWIHCIHLLLAVADGGYVLLFQESCIKIFFFHKLIWELFIKFLKNLGLPISESVVMTFVAFCSRKVFEIKQTRLY